MVAGGTGNAVISRHIRAKERLDFVNEAELEYAKILDYHGVPWLYEPHTFVLERDAEGRVTEAFTPDFYLPEQDLYLEVTVMKQSLVTRKNRKLRKLRKLYPDVRVKLFYVGTSSGSRRATACGVRPRVDAIGERTRRLLYRRAGQHATAAGC